MIKSTLLAAVFCLSASAFACPDLTGTWTCTDFEGKTSQSVVTQEVIENGVLYKIANEKGEVQEFPANGVAYTSEDADFSSTMVSTCVSSALIKTNYKMVGKSYDFMADVDMTFELADPSTLNVKAVGFTSNKSGGDKQAINQSSKCVK